jgi:hypothetical protein
MSQKKSIIYGGGLKAKGFAIACVASLAAGWLSRELVHGKISGDTRLAAYILDGTVAAMLVFLSVVGARRWVAGRLSTKEKLTTGSALLLFAVFFAMGWKWVIIS